MTIIAIWYEPSDDALWSIADTRISTPGATGNHIIRSDSGAKLFMLPIACRVVCSEADFRPLPYFVTTFGFAFAGDVLPASMTFGTASTMLQSLVSVTKSSPPTLYDIAKLVSRVGERFSRECLGSSNGTYGKFEAAVFGYCAHLRKYAVYHLTPTLDQSTFSISVTESLPEDNLGITILGNGKEELNTEIDYIQREGDPYQRSGRIPKLAVEAMVKKSNGPIGGSLAIGIASRFNYDLYWWAQPLEYGKPQAIRSFNGIDLDEEIGVVGDYLIGMNGMV